MAAPVEDFVLPNDRASTDGDDDQAQGRASGDARNDFVEDVSGDAPEPSYQPPTTSTLPPTNHGRTSAPSLLTEQGSRATPTPTQQQQQSQQQLHGTTITRTLVGRIIAQQRAVADPPLSADTEDALQQTAEALGELRRRQDEEQDDANGGAEGERANKSARTEQIDVAGRHSAGHDLAHLIKLMKRILRWQAGHDKTVGRAPFSISEEHACAVLCTVVLIRADARGLTADSFREGWFDEAVEASYGDLFQGDGDQVTDANVSQDVWRDRVRALLSVAYKLPFEYVERAPVAAPTSVSTGAPAIGHSGSSAAGAASGSVAMDNDFGRPRKQRPRANEMNRDAPNIPTFDTNSKGDPLNDEFSEERYGFSREKIDYIFACAFHKNEKASIAVNLCRAATGVNEPRVLSGMTGLAATTVRAILEHNRATVKLLADEDEDRTPHQVHPDIPDSWNIARRAAAVVTATGASTKLTMSLVTTLEGLPMWVGDPETKGTARMTFERHVRHHSTQRVLPQNTFYVMEAEYHGIDKVMTPNPHPKTPEEHHQAEMISRLLAPCLRTARQISGMKFMTDTKNFDRGDIFTMTRMVAWAIAQVIRMELYRKPPLPRPKPGEHLDDRERSARERHDMIHAAQPHRNDAQPHRNDPLPPRRRERTPPRPVVRSRRDPFYRDEDDNRRSGDHHGMSPQQSSIGVRLPQAPPPSFAASTAAPSRGPWPPAGGAPPGYGAPQGYGTPGVPPEYAAAPAGAYGVPAPGPDAYYYGQHQQPPHQYYQPQPQQPHMHHQHHQHQHQHHQAPHNFRPPSPPRFGGGYNGSAGGGYGGSKNTGGGGRGDRR
jgi:hypothetical protein